MPQDGEYCFHPQDKIPRKRIWGAHQVKCMMVLNPTRVCHPLHAISPVRNLTALVGTTETTIAVSENRWCWTRICVYRAILSRLPVVMAIRNSNTPAMITSSVIPGRQMAGRMAVTWFRFQHLLFLHIGAMATRQLPLHDKRIIASLRFHRGGTQRTLSGYPAPFGVTAACVSPCCTRVTP